MVFGRKKNRTGETDSSLRMRGRDRSDHSAGLASGTEQNPLAKRFQPEDEPDTVDLEQPARFQQASDSESGEPGTRILGGEAIEEQSPTGEALEDPVAGFLVVVSGPGRGSVHKLGYGMNPIGRDASQRVSLNHGDQRISRENHAVLTFDPVLRKFYILQGEGPGLCYLNNEAVLAPTELPGGSHLKLGDTVLRMLALCGEDFLWDQDSATLPGP